MRTRCRRRDGRWRWCNNQRSGSEPRALASGFARPLANVRGSVGPTIMATDDTGTGALRVESWAGEVRVNLIRSIALSAFYGYHLLNVYVLNPDVPALRGDLHLMITF